MNAMMPEAIAKAIAKRSEYSDLKMVVLNMVAAKLQGENLGHYQKLWNTADTDRSGTLSEQEFTRMLQKQGVSQSKAQDLFELADIDGSGNIDFNEFVAVMFNPDAMSTSVLQDHLKFIFHEIGGDDSIDEREFVKAFPEGQSSTVIKQLFKAVDKDRSGHISKKEFIDFVSRM